MTGAVQGAYTIQIAGEGTLSSGEFSGTVSGALNGTFTGSYETVGGQIVTQTDYDLAEGDVIGTSNFLNLTFPTFTFGGTLEAEEELPPTTNSVLTFSEFVGGGTTDHTLTFIVADASDSVLDTTADINSLGAAASGPIDVDLVASEVGAPFTNLTGVVTNVPPAGVAEFDAQFTGDSNGNGDSFELHFVDDATSTLLGSIPVSINNGYFYLVEAVDPDNDPIEYFLTDAPEGATMDPETALIEWNPPAPGEYDFSVRVEDGRGGYDEQDFTVVVTDDSANNSPPTIEAIDDRSGQVGREFEVPVSANDPDNDILKYYLTDAPTGMSIDVDTGLISWLPEIGQENQQHSVTVKVFDRRGGSATESFTVDVPDAEIFVNTPPEITSTPPTAGVAGIVYHYPAEAYDADGDDLTWELTLGPEGAGIDSKSGDLVWRPKQDQIGLHAFTVTVTSDNDPPDIEQTPIPGASVGNPWEYQVKASDPNGDVLTYTLDPDSLDLGMTIGEFSGLIEWTDPDEGSYGVKVLVEDGRGGAGLLTFTLPVTDNALPRIDSIPTGPALVGEQW